MADSCDYFIIKVESCLDAFNEMLQEEEMCGVYILVQ